MRKAAIEPLGASPVWNVCTEIPAQYFQLAFN